MSTYTKIENIDYRGSDIRMEKNKTLEELKSICDNDDTCKGFNLGKKTYNGSSWFKHTLKEEDKVDDNLFDFYVKNKDPVVTTMPVKDTVLTTMPVKDTVVTTMPNEETPDTAMEIKKEPEHTKDSPVEIEEDNKMIMYSAAGLSICLVITSSLVLLMRR